MNLRWMFDRHPAEPTQVRCVHTAEESDPQVACLDCLLDELVEQFGTAEPSRPVDGVPRSVGC